MRGWGAAQCQTPGAISFTAGSVVRRLRRSGRRRSARRAARDGELVLGVLDALLELPAVGRRLAGLDLLELDLRRLELRLGSGVVDLLDVDRVVDEREGAVELDLEEPGPGGEL